MDQQGLVEEGLVASIPIGFEESVWSRAAGGQYSDDISPICWQPNKFGIQILPSGAMSKLFKFTKFDM
jgi:hypothetical protein